MKTKSKDLLTVVKTLATVRGELKTLSLMEVDLKAQIKAHMGPERLLEAGDWMCVIETRNTSTLDRDALMHDMGNDFIAKYTKRTEYDTLSVKPLKAVKHG